MMPLISCIMPTMPERRLFVRQAIEYFLRFTYPEKELIVVDSAPGDPEFFKGYPPNVRYGVKDGNVWVGAKMNFGVERANGDILIKMDDDDWYHPEILSDIWELMKGDPERTIPRVIGAGFFLIRKWRLKLSGDRPWLLGGVLPFHRRFWEKSKFREDIKAGSDYHFRKTGVYYKEAILMRKDRYVVVRHGVHHTWNRDHADVDVDAMLENEPDHPQTPEDFFGEDCAFYQGLREKLLEA
jgi:glycosyltransferase involved in cell wall biosynthesis